MLNASLKLPVKFGLSQLDRPMTHAQATRWGKTNMPADLSVAGFKVGVFRSDPELHGADFYRVSFGK